MSNGDSISTSWISGVTMRCILAQRDLRDTQGVIAVATTVAHSDEIPWLLPNCDDRVLPGQRRMLADNGPS